MKGKITQGNPMFRALLLGAAIAVLGVWTLSMAACDMDNAVDDVPVESGRAVYTGTHSDVTYTLTITEKASGKAVYTPKTGDSYTLKISGSLSSGKVSLAETTGSTLKFTLKPEAAAAANTFSVTVSPGSNKITNVTGTVTFDAGGTKAGPGNLNNSDSSSSSGSSSSSVKGVSLDLTTLSLVVGGATPTLIATVTPSKATDKSVAWASSNSGVATVSSGKVTAVSAGRADITVTTADGGKKATCKVTVYDKGTTNLTGIVTIAGTAEVGKTLTAVITSLDGSGTISYQWKRETTNIGTNSNTYVVTSDDKDSTITVTVSRSGYTGSITSVPTASVNSGATASVDDPSLPELQGYVWIEGFAQVGQTLKARATFYEVSGGTIFYQWKRGTTVIGTNSPNYVVAIGDIGSTITVTVTCSGNSGKFFYETEAVTPAGTLIGNVRINGMPQVGYTLTVGGIDTLIGKGTISYQWKSGNTAVGTNDAYLLTNDDKDFKITLTVTRSDFPGSSIKLKTDTVTDNDFIYDAETDEVTITGFDDNNDNWGGYIDIPGTLDGKPVTSIGANAFKNKKLTYVYTGKNVTSIGDYAFDGNPLKEVDIEKNVTIGTSAFPPGFITVYAGNNRAAGTYWRNNPNSEVWSKD